MYLPLTTRALDIPRLAEVSDVFAAVAEALVALAVAALPVRS